MNFKIQEKGIICPSCLHTYYDQAKISMFIDQIRSLENKPVYYDSKESVYFSAALLFSLENKTDISVKWACNECIGRGKAIIATDINNQNRGMGTPIFAFFDEEKKCQLCNAEFIFRSDEHKYWVENLEFFHLATRIYCESCQSEITKHKRLSEQMANLKSTELTPDQIVKYSIEASKLYTELGKNAKAKGILKLGLKRLMKDKSTNSELIKGLKIEYNKIIGASLITYLASFFLLF